MSCGLFSHERLDGLLGCIKSGMEILGHWLTIGYGCVEDMNGGNQIFEDFV